ncbi:sensor histidine kinase [Tistlia consotensis]|uniref:sensor histidine kinase n=1 Tax=Tistlia consotensis TaxID=1321365 RepID=UPI001180FE05|nr:ATP-binding protein [Tistlia consotensis]
MTDACAERRAEEAAPSDPAERRIGPLARRLPPIPASLSCSETFAIFEGQPGLRGLAVQEEGRPLGMVSRDTLMISITNPVRHALYERRPIRLLMNRSPLIVDAEMTVDEVFELIAESRGAALGEGFIVTRGGTYLGVGSSLDLLRESVLTQRQRILELELARRAAEQASEAKSSFLANLSHELRTPLNAVIGFAELLESAVVGPLNERQLGYLRDIHGSGHLLLRLISDLLDLSRAESGRLDLFEEQVGLSALVESGARTLSPRARSHGLELAVDLPGDPLLVLGDERKLLQVLLNLGTNAVKFTPRGGRVVLRAGIDTDAGPFFEVEDSGIGIAEEELPKVLETFGRSDDPFTRRTEGAGLGLSLCRAFVELHGGRLELASRLGEGTRVRAALPAARLLEAEQPRLERA